MKKNLLKVVFATMFTLVAGYTVYTSQESEITLSSLAMVNIEALANDENGACSFSKVEKDQKKNKLHCEGFGRLCCVMN